MFVTVFKLFALREQKSMFFFSRSKTNSFPLPSSSNSSRESITRDRNGFKERKLYKSL